MDTKKIVGCALATDTSAPLEVAQIARPAEVSHSGLVMISVHRATAATSSQAIVALHTLALLVVAQVARLV